MKVLVALILAIAFGTAMGEQVILLKCDVNLRTEFPSGNRENERLAVEVEIEKVLKQTFISVTGGGRPIGDFMSEMPKKSTRRMSMISVADSSNEDKWEITNISRVSQGLFSKITKSIRIDRRTGTLNMTSDSETKDGRVMSIVTTGTCDVVDSTKRKF